MTEQRKTAAQREAEKIAERIAPLYNIQGDEVILALTIAAREGYLKGLYTGKASA